MLRTASWQYLATGTPIDRVTATLTQEKRLAARDFLINFKMAVIAKSRLTESGTSGSYAWPKLLENSIGHYETLIWI